MGGNRNRIGRRGKAMKQTITRLASSIIDLAGEIGTEAEARR